MSDAITIKEPMKKKEKCFLIIKENLIDYSYHSKLYLNTTHVIEFIL